MMDMFWIIITKTYNIAHFPRVLPKDVINLQKYTRKQKEKLASINSD